MKTHACSLLAAVFASIIAAGCGKTPPGTSRDPLPPRTKLAIPADHSLDVETGFAASDLNHGHGAVQLTVMRRWNGTATLNTLFGPGWSDQNSVRLTLVSSNVLLIWRGGIGSNVAYRNEAKVFEGDDGEKFQQTDKGWMGQLSHGRILTFDSAGRLTSEQGATGPVRNYNYDKNGRLISVGTGPGNQLTYSYNKEGTRVSHVDGPEGLGLDYAYDNKGRLASLVNSRKIRTEYRYADDGRLIAAKDQFGNQIELEGVTAARQLAGNATPKRAALPGFAHTKYQFDAHGRVKSATEGANSKSYEYDEAGRLSGISAPEGGATCKYDSFGRIATIQNTGGTSVRFEYNNLDLPTLLARADGTAEKRTYDQHGRLLRSERSAGDWAAFSYDSAGRIGSRRTPPAAEVRYSYDDADRTVGTQYSDGRAVSYEYDPSGRLRSESWSSGEKRMWRYGDNGQLAETVSPAGLATAYTYDALGRLASTEDNIHGKTMRRPFAGGMIVETARGQTITTTTKWGKPLTVVAPGGPRTVFNYDEKGQLRTVLSPLNLPWRYEYDPAGRLTAIVAPSGLQISTGWDAEGRETKVARGSVVWREFQYNPAGRIEQEHSGTGRAMRYAYDRDGRLAEMELPDGKVAYASKQGGLQSVRKGPGYEVEETYTADGMLTRRQYQPAGLDLKLPRDSAGRAGGIELNTLKATYAYDGRGQLSQIALPGGTTIKVTMDEAGRPAEFAFGSIVEKIAYDRADRIATIEATTSSGARVFSERYAYGPRGNLAERITDSTAPIQFNYDADSRLTQVIGEREQVFVYDVDGNLRTNGDGAARCEIDSLGRPTQQGPTTYSWDAGGNLVGMQDARVKIDHVFDTAGRLTERRNGKGIWKFGYLDGTDRLWKESASGKSWYAYAGERLAGWKDEAGVTWLLVCLPGTDRPLAVCGSNGKTLFVLHDRLGSARRFVDAAGTVVARHDYGAFGKLEASAGSAPVQLFAGIIRDETGLFYARQRYYDPAIARFISIDPLIGTPGSPSSHNAYAYAANNPLRFRDPLGAGSFEDEIADYNKQYPYKTARDAAGKEYVLTHEDGPFRGEPIVDKSGPLSTVKNGAYDHLTGAEKVATRQAWEAKQAALRQLQNPASTAQDTRAAAQALAQHDADLARLNEIGRLRNSHNLMEWGTSEKGYGGAGTDAAMARQEQRLAELGVDPLGHYTPGTQERLRAQNAAGIKPSEAPQAKEAARQLAAAQEAAEASALAEADAAARDARAAGAFGRNGKTQQVPATPGTRESTGAVTAKDGAANAGNKTAQITPGEGSGETPAGATKVAAESSAESSADLAARARGKIERGLKNNEAVSISKAEMDAFKAEEAAKAAPKAGQGAAVAKSDASAGGPSTGSTAGDARSGGNGSKGSTAWDEELYTGKGVNKSGRVPGDIEMVYDAEKGLWKPKFPSGSGSSFAPAAEEAGERWLGPKILDAAGKVLKPLGKALGPVLKGVEIIQTVQLAGTMANNFIDTLNQPFMEAQKEKQGARWLGERYANDLRQLAAADPEQVIMGDGHKFDPNNPKDLEELMLGLSQNLSFGRKPFDGLLKDITNKPTSFMGADKKDTAASFTLENAQKLMRTAATLQKAAGEASKECIREEEEAKAQLQTALTIAAGRAAVESDLATLPETANDVKTQTAEVRAQTKALQAAFDQMKAAGSQCETAATNICNLAAQSSSATEEQVKAWRVQATSELFAASDLLNAAQAKIDGADTSMDQLGNSVAVLEGFRTSLMVYKAAGGVADTADVTPDAAFKAAKAAAGRAGAARGKLGPILDQLRAIPPQVTTLLAPYVSQNIEAAALDAEARRIGERVDSAPLVDVGALIALAAPMIDAALLSQKGVERAIGNTNLDATISAAREALAEAGNVRNGARALAAGAERYQALQRGSECLRRIRTAAETAIAKTTEEKPTDKPEGGTADTKMPDEEVTVPDLSVFSGSGEMKAVLAHAGLAPGFGMAKGDPPKDKEFNWFAGQSPAAGAKAKKGDTVTIFAYQQPDAKDGTSPEKPTPPGDATKPGTMPNLIGLTLDQATTRLTARMQIGGDEVGSKPPAPEKAFTIYLQSPVAGALVPADKMTTVTVKRYGTAKTEEPANPPDAPGKNPLGGKWNGKYAHWKGPVTRTVDGKSIGNLGFSIRERGDGGFFYIVEGLALTEVQTQPGKVTGREGGKDYTAGIHFTYTIESKGENLSIEKIEHSTLPGAAPTQTIVRGLLVPTTENQAGWSQMMSDAEVQTMIDADKKKRGQ